MVDTRQEGKEREREGGRHAQGGRRRRGEIKTYTHRSTYPINLKRGFLLVAPIVARPVPNDIRAEIDLHNRIFARTHFQDGHRVGRDARVGNLPRGDRGDRSKELRVLTSEDLGHGPAVRMPNHIDTLGVFCVGVCV